MSSRSSSYYSSCRLKIAFGFQVSIFRFPFPLSVVRFCFLFPFPFLMTLADDFIVFDCGALGLGGIDRFSAPCHLRNVKVCLHFPVQSSLVPASKTNRHQFKNAMTQFLKKENPVAGDHTLMSSLIRTSILGINSRTR